MREQAREQEQRDKGLASPDSSKDTANTDMLFFSMHLFHPLQPLAPGSGEQYEFYPGTGGADRTLENIINVPISPCWCAGGGTAKGTRGHNTKRAKADTSQTNSQPTSATSTSTEGGARGGGGGATWGEILQLVPRLIFGGLSRLGGVGRRVLREV